MLPRALVFPRLAAVHAARRMQLHTSPALTHGHPEYWWGPEKAAGRELVGFGFNGDNNYVDRLDYWYPAIRFRKEDDVIKPLREKEKGDWKKLSPEERKLLYRYSFKQTLSEFEAPNGYWKLIVATCFFVTAVATFYATFLQAYVYPPLPPTFDNEWKEESIRRKIILEKGQFLGPAKYWDYEKNQWKR